MSRPLLRRVLAVALALPSVAWGGTLGLPPLPEPPKLLAELGRQLFFDRRLSANGTLSCAMCHLPQQGFTVNELRTSVGMEGTSLRRNAPTLWNVAYVRELFVDGRAASLEAQALQPLLHPDEMGNPSLPALMRRIAALPEYGPRFRRAFGSVRPTPQRVAAAIASFERTLVAGDAPFDRWRYGGRADAIGERAQRGFELFDTLGCTGCHLVGERDALFTDDQFHDTGVQARSDARNAGDAEFTLAAGLRARFDPPTLRRIGAPDQPDHGRYEVTRREADRRAFRTPGLRNVALTAPYMHDGSLATLEDVVDHYAAGGSRDDPLQDARIRPLQITADERAALVEFLKSLTSDAALRATAHAGGASP